ncbi:MAG: FeoB-associated Cys-rich membrane protein [Acholeplasmatales bacterium]|jgi:L-asparagine transporter-like permease|nr:FeoB-associated Cys-rich membrane protein [Acholeplasmatales bacterium]
MIILDVPANLFANLMVLLVVALILGGILFYVIKNRKKGACASCSKISNIKRDFKNINKDKN